jgi:sialate O-acetylesterase
LVLPIMAVRYAFTNVAITNLQNGAGLPAEPFRTDNWNN